MYVVISLLMPHACCINLLALCLSSDVESALERARKHAAALAALPETERKATTGKLHDACGAHMIAFIARCDSDYRGYRPSAEQCVVTYVRRVLALQLKVVELAFVGEVETFGKKLVRL